MTSKFLKGYIAGIATGVIFRDPIVRTLRNLADKANEKANEMEVKEEVKADPVNGDDKPSANRPASGSDLPSVRIKEINDSSPDNPVYLTDDEVATLSSHNVNYLRVALGAKRLLIRGINDGHLAS